jgi:hypothetical protein
MQKFFAVAVGSVVALVGFADAANASATLDLIWIDKTDSACIDADRRDCPQLGTTISSVAVTDNITLAVILTAGPNGSMGASVSVNYGDALPSLSVVGFQSLTTTVPFVYLPLHLGTTTNQSPYIDGINAGALPAGSIGIGLPAGQSAYLGTVSFHKDLVVNGIFEIAVGTDGPGRTDDVLDGVGNTITSTTTFNSAYLITASEPVICTLEIEVNALRVAGKTIRAGSNRTVDVTAKARIRKGTGTALPATTLDTTLTINAVDGTTVIGTNSTAVDAITLGVGKGGKGAKLEVGVPQCTAGFIEFDATFFGRDAAGNECWGRETLRKDCR